MPRWSLYVRSWGQSGKHMLAMSFSGFDPTRTLACILVRPVSALSHGVRLRARQSISLRLRICDGFRVVVREVGRHRKCSRLQVIDTMPILDPWARYVFTLHVKRQADHDVATVGPMLPHPGVVFFHALDQCHKGVIEPIRVFRVPMHPLGCRRREEIIPSQIAKWLLCRE